MIFAKTASSSVKITVMTQIGAYLEASFTTANPTRVIKSTVRFRLSRNMVGTPTLNLRAMFKHKYIFRHENGEFEALCNPMHIRQAAAVALYENKAKFMEVADANTGKTEMICVYREANPNGGFMFLFPED